MRTLDAREMFIEACERTDGDAWREKLRIIWDCVAQRKMAIASAARALRPRTPEFFADLEQELWIQMARKIQSKPDLLFDPTRAPTLNAFLGFVYRVMYHEAAQSVRSVRRRHFRDLPLADGVDRDDGGKRGTVIDDRIDLSLMLEAIKQEHAALIKQLLDGKAVKEIAADHGYSLSAAYRRCRQAQHAAARYLKRECV